MGLDMYLIKKNEKDSGKPEENVVLYWRKANQIHNWFVRNIQNGEDKCNIYEVSREDLVTLYRCCRSVMRQKHKAHEILPTMEGFFFGNTEYDTYFFQEVKRTRDELKDIITTFDFRNEKLYYTSWW
ncbi:hypothetical protein [Salipaludibacillus aurantiacus]|uniref:Uncharacterized protein n=1 Tax=Salipaludibacillus aurantiacus TaxID=1601833 RepID=A0A1H9NUY4_9BACI|nr:hypothetical protein [Salipaludibacillus aurantiacus]SER39854.1 hypothetical protein SAMN05518684_10114 [Salipaludibacillus aurantiacus]